MSPLFRNNRKARLLVIIAAVIVFLVGALAAGKWVVWPRVKAWREQRTNNVAREKFVAGDYAAAMTAVRTSLRYNPNSLDTWKLGAEIAAKQKIPEQILFLQRVAILQPTLENRLNFLRIAVDLNAFPQAQDVISKVGREGASNPEFLKIAAQVSLRLGKPTTAKAYLMSLVSLSPNDNEARFELARIRLREGFNENRPAIRAEIKTLSEDPSLHERALALLLADDLLQKEPASALDLASRLATALNLTAPNQILIAETYRRFAPGKNAEYLSKLEQRLSDTPENATTLAGYLVSSEQCEELLHWVATLPDSIKNADGVQANQGLALMRLERWDELETFLRGCHWKETEFLRHAFLAYKYRIVGNDRQFSDEWRLAVIELGNNVRKLDVLLARVSNWNWNEERYELLWKRFSIEPNDPALRQQLIAWESNKGNTSGLNRLFARIVEVSPQDANSKNNLAYTSLLLGTNLERAFEIANENYKADPKNPYFITTRSLALEKQGKPQEAIQTLESLDIVSLAQPDRINLHALYLAEAGRIQEAADLARSVREAALSLPEERKLLDNARALVAKAEREQGNAARLASFTSQRGTSSATQKSWIAVLPDQLRSSPSVSMELSDTYYAVDDFRGLESSLKSDRWEQNDFLRLALLAYAQRNQGKDTDARANWRTAVAGAGANPKNLNALADLCERWSWTQERIEIFGRVFQRDPQNDKVFNELSDFYGKNGQTLELARLYEQRCDANPGDLSAKARFAYYSLLAGSNLSRAQVLAREAYDAAREDPFRTKVYAFSLYKENRTGDAWRLLETLPDTSETGMAQASLLKATILLQRKDPQRAAAALARFDRSTCLPEENVLADALGREIEKAAK